MTRYWPFVREIHSSPMNSPHKGQWRGALMFFFICVWINGWINNGEAGDLRRHRPHYDVIVMENTGFIRSYRILISGPCTKTVNKLKGSFLGVSYLRLHEVRASQLRIFTHGATCHMNAKLWYSFFAKCKYFSWKTISRIIFCLRRRKHLGFGGLVLNYNFHGTQAIWLQYRDNHINWCLS